MAKMMIYGLPRSGTNYLEYMVRNYVDVDYDNQYRKNPYMGISSSTKHCEPNLEDGGDYNILIYKSWPNYKESFNKWHNKKRVKKPKEMYDKAMSDYVKFYEANPDTTIIVRYEDALNNEQSLFEYIGTKFGLNVKDNLEAPKRRMNRSGGKGMVMKPFVDNTNKALDNSPIDKLRWVK